MRIFLSGFLLCLVLGLAPTAWAESPPPEATSESSAEQAPIAAPETTPPASSEQGVESRGLFPSIPPPPPLPKIRALSAAEITLAKSVFENTINYSLVKVTDTLGAGGRPWTTNTPPIYTINVGSAYSSLTADNDRKRLLIHELAHVWQGQHLVPFMLNSAAHQTLSAINNGGDVASAYAYTVGKPWNQYNVEQQASIVTHWYTPSNICFQNGPCGGGMKTTDARYPYIRDHIRKNKPN